MAIQIGEAQFRKLLSSFLLFDKVEQPVCDFILRAAPVQSLTEGQRLFERGDSGGTMYVVLQGRIEISMLTEAGRKISLNHIKTGECFGEISMFDSFPRSASAVALENVFLLPIRSQTFTEASQRCPILALNMIQILCERIRWTSSSVEDYALLSLERRLARRLLLLQEKFADKNGEIRITQNDLADFVGSSRESTNKVLTQWKAAGLIDVGRGSIVIVAKEKLDHVAHEGTQVHGSYPH
jgi:CRP/FNR family transcriptional regulator, cyclic AMP receptor protein